MFRKNVLVVAFDGLDYELIKEFDLENIVQQETGAIDNGRGISAIYTSELFTSFVTGQTHEIHGVKGLTQPRDEKKQRVLDTLTPEFLVNNVRGFWRLRRTLEGFLEKKDDIKYDKDDLEANTLFDEIDNSRAMFVPGYNPSMFWKSDSDISVIDYGYSASEVEKYLRTREHSFRKEELFHELGNNIVSPRDFLMCHFHFPDWIHHLYGDETIGRFDEKKLREVYNEMDRLASETKDKALDAGYDYVIFMSDHGLPTEHAHNENAFYSCNKELFGDETPHITDFHDKILRLTGNEDKIESN